KASERYSPGLPGVSSNHLRIEFQSSSESVSREVLRAGKTCPLAEGGTFHGTTSRGGCVAVQQLWSGTTPLQLVARAPKSVAGGRWRRWYSAINLHRCTVWAESTSRILQSIWLGLRYKCPSLQDAAAQRL